MTLLIDTETVPPDHRIEAWADAATRGYHPVSIDPMANRPYAGRMQQFDLGAVAAFLVAADPNTVLRTPRGIASGDPERMDFYVMRRGRCRMAQGNRACVIGPGDMAHMDSSRPYVMRAMEPFELVSFSLPKLMLRAHLDAISARTATRIPADSSVGSLMAPFLSGLVDRLRSGELANREEVLSDGIFGLIRALAMEGAGVTGPQLSSGLRPRIKAFIESNLGDPQLGPENIAAAHFISVRYLHKLFEQEGVSVSELIRHRRLDACRRDLGDPALAHQTIMSVAARWGLTNGPHFSRLFRARYGCSPRDYRRRATGA
jgi:AraC-like DNA-binding protein